MVSRNTHPFGIRKRDLDHHAHASRSPRACLTNLFSATNLGAHGWFFGATWRCKGPCAWFPCRLCGQKWAVTDVGIRRNYMITLLPSQTTITHLYHYHDDQINIIGRQLWGSHRNQEFYCQSSALVLHRRAHAAAPQFPIFIRFRVQASKLPLLIVLTNHSMQLTDALVPAAW